MSRVVLDSQFHMTSGKSGTSVVHHMGGTSGPASHSIYYRGVSLVDLFGTGSARKKQNVSKSGTTGTTYPVEALDVDVPLIS